MPVTGRFAPVMPAILACLGAAPLAIAQTASPGFALEEYAQVPTPAHLVFGSDGTLYAGNSDNTLAGVFPHRVTPGGAPVEPLSATRIYDPDGVALDADGAISGVPGSVLVATIGSGGTGRIWAVRPGGAVDPLFAATGWNPQEMVFDSAGRLLIAEPTTQSVLVSTGSAPETLFSLPTVVAVIAVDARGRIYTCADDGVVRIHSSAGVEVDPAYATFPARAYLDLGRGSGFGAALYALDESDGRIYRISASGGRTEIARGFDTVAVGDIRDIGFGPDGALYIAYTSDSSIWRLTACGGDCDGSGSLDFFDFLCFQDLFAAGDPYADCDGSGSLDFFDFLCFQNAFAAGCP